MKRNLPPSSARVGLRDIASAAGVCLMTVSLSLRDSPKISRSTRERIQQLAQKLGYHPDPEISRLMKHLRSSRTAEGRTGIAVIDFFPGDPFQEHTYHRSIREGIAARAGELGFGVTSFSSAEYGFNLRHLLNVVRARGIEGVILMPCVGNPLALDPAVDWKGLSVVATTNSILSPRFHSVVPHQFANMMRLIETMQAHGYRKIGAIFEGFFDDRTAHNFTAALNWNHHGRRILMLSESINRDAQARLILPWLAKHQPDLIFAQSIDAVTHALGRAKSSRMRHTRIVGLGSSDRNVLSYLDERPELVGAGAVDLLAGMVYYHETGVPAHPRTTMIDGELRFCGRESVGNPALATA